jgi:hypothetical protein
MGGLEPYFPGHHAAIGIIIRNSHGSSIAGATIHAKLNSVIECEAVAIDLQRY